MILFALLLRLLYPGCSISVEWGRLHELFDHPAGHVIEECDEASPDWLSSKLVFVNVREAYSSTFVVRALICKCQQALPERSR
jgi:hypothetical protein